MRRRYCGSGRRWKCSIPGELSVVAFRYVGGVTGADAAGSKLNLSIFEALRAGGRVFLSSTRLGGRVALRLCFVQLQRTTADDVEEARWH